MKLAFYSTQAYDRDYFSRLNPGHEITYFETPLSEKSVNLLTDETGVCVFVNDKLTSAVIEALAKKGIKLIALRCAG
jgi:D-lactate dehydrogenase